ncbi:MAG: family 16 glycosylhydrolase [Prevotella sp.]|nr:family 16 glycosylhydrolase [Prevotella sp.]
MRKIAKPGSYLWALLLPLFSLLACSSSSGDDDPATSVSITITPASVSIPAAGGTAAVGISVEGNQEWGAYSNVDWIAVTTASTASSKGTVTVSVEANNTGKDRTGTVTVMSGTARKTFDVSQGVALQVLAAQVYSLSRGETLTVEVIASAPWTASTDAGWLKVERAAGGNGETLKIETAPNTGLTYRTGTVKVTTETGETAEVTVKQESGEATEITAPEGYKLVWHDEFSQDGTLGADWTHEVQNSGWVNNELQNYRNGVADGRRVTELVDGKLNINCFKGSDGKVYSGRVYAKVKEGWTYGYIEARIMLPKGKGTWPAFWMMPVNFRSWPADGEIDIMEEVGVNPNYVSSSLHANSHVHSNNTQVTHEMKCEGAEEDFHVYAITWTHENITTYVDGKVQLSYDNRGLGRDDWPYDDPFYVIFNLAWGGDWGGMNGVDESALPVTMKVDYIRVFQK